MEIVIVGFELTEKDHQFIDAMVLNVIGPGYITARIDLASVEFPVQKDFSDYVLLVYGKKASTRIHLLTGELGNYAGLFYLPDPKKLERDAGFEDNRKIAFLTLQEAKRLLERSKNQPTNNIEETIPDSVDVALKTLKDNGLKEVTGKDKDGRIVRLTLGPENDLRADANLTISELLLFKSAMEILGVKEFQAVYSNKASR